MILGSGKHQREVKPPELILLTLAAILILILNFNLPDLILGW